LIQELREEIVSDFKGTIIDIETIGDFNGRYRNTGDWREYEGIQQVIFGYVNSQYLQILWVKQKEEIAELNDRVAKIIDTLEKPFYAFNTAFEKNVLTCQLGRAVNVECELQREKFESKSNAVRELRIPATATRLMIKVCCACMPGRTVNLIKPLPTTAPA